MPPRRAVADVMAHVASREGGRRGQGSLLALIFITGGCTVFERVPFFFFPLPLTNADAAQGSARAGKGETTSTGPRIRTEDTSSGSGPKAHGPI